MTIFEDIYRDVNVMDVPASVQMSYPFVEPAHTDVMDIPQVAQGPCTKQTRAVEVYLAHKQQ